MVEDGRWVAETAAHAPKAMAGIETTVAIYREPIGIEVWMDGSKIRVKRSS